MPRNLCRWNLHILPPISHQATTGISYALKKKAFVSLFLILLVTSRTGHFTVMDGSEAGVDFVLIQTFLLYYANQVILMLTSIF